MTRIQQVNPAEADGVKKDLLEAVNGKLGMVPNIIKALASSNAALKAYLNFSDALSTGSLDARLRERISLAISQQNECHYCLAAHSALGKMAGLSEEDIIDARKGGATDSKADAAVKFALKVLETRGFVSDQDINRVYTAGYNDGEVAEIVGLVALNVFTNYFNHVAETEIDFPAAKEINA